MTAVTPERVADVARRAGELAKTNGHAVGVQDPGDGDLQDPGDPAVKVVLSSEDLLEQVKAELERYVVFSNEHQVVAVALWVLHTYIFRAFDVTPYLHVSSATKQSGKTRLFEVLVHLVAKAWMTGGVSAAALFRKIERVMPTLLLDEIDTMFGDDPEMTSSIKGILNTGYSRSGVFTRCVGQGQNIEEKDFATYCPKAFAGIGSKLPDTVVDRSIPIMLKRRSPTERKPARFRQREATAELAPLAVQLRAWGRTQVKSIGAREHQTLEGLSDRQEDIWQPLFAVAALAGGDWPERAEWAALALHEGTEDADLTVQLLGHIRDAFDDLGERLPTLQILEHLVSRGDASPWAHWWAVDIERAGSHLQSAAQGLARQLKPVGIRAKKIRFGETSKQGFERSDFEDAWSRYLSVPALPGTTSEHRNIAGQSLFLGVPAEGAKGANSAPEQGCSDVPMQEGGKVEQSVWDDPGDHEATFWSTPDADAYLASVVGEVQS
jgi:hypothetical protein